MLPLNSNNYDYHVPHDDMTPARNGENSKKKRKFEKMEPKASPWPQTALTASIPFQVSSPFHNSTSCTIPNKKRKHVNDPTTSLAALTHNFEALNLNRSKQLKAGSPQEQSQSTFPNLPPMASLSSSNATGTSFFNTLPLNAFKKILSFLLPSKRAEISRVSKLFNSTIHPQSNSNAQKTFKLDVKKIDDSHLEWIAKNISDLDTLILNAEFMNVSRKGLMALASMKGLKNLCMTVNPFFEPNLLLSLSHYPMLRFLKLENLPIIDDSLLLILEKLQNVEEMELCVKGGFIDITDKSQLIDSPLCAKLSRISFEECHEIKAEMLSIFELFPNLLSIKFIDFPTLTNENLKKLMLPNSLTSFSLVNSEGYIGGGLSCLEGLRNLQFVNLGHIDGNHSRITECAILCLRELPALRIVSLRGTQFSASKVEEFQEFFKNKGVRLYF